VQESGDEILVRDLQISKAHSLLAKCALILIENPLPFVVPLNFGPMAGVLVNMDVVLEGLKVEVSSSPTNFIFNPEIRSNSLTLG